MPWLYFSLKPKLKAWAVPWQQQLQQRLMALETVTIQNDCFIAPDAQLFAEPGRTIAIQSSSFIAANCVLHGPITIGSEVAINHGCTIDGGRQGVTIGDKTRIAAGCYIYAFNHGMAPDDDIYRQPVVSLGIHIGSDVWIGANVGIRDGVNIGNHAIVGMGAQVCHDVPEYAIVAGNPARVIGDRRDKARAGLKKAT
ncbi:acyltransferase [Paraferrimonas haliotis]|nr:acyltransferase [Paraferrimonas haliotis]